MNITIDQIVNDPHLKTEIIAGFNGLENKVTWAHVCELSDPSIWLIGGELVMTNGIPIPNDPNEQVEYLKILINSGASGLAIGKDLHAPNLSKQFLDYANANDFPILLTDYEIPWIALAKTVAITNSNQDYSRLTTMMKLYNLIPHSVYDESTPKMVHFIGDIISANIKIVDAKNNNVMFEINPDHATTKTEQDVHTKPIKVNIPSSRPTYLIIEPFEENKMDTLILNHLSTIIGLFIEKDIATYERKRRNGSEVLLGLIEDQFNDEVTTMFLEEHQLHAAPLCMVACNINEEEYNSSLIHIQLYERNIPNIMTLKDKTLFVLLPDNDESIELLSKELPEDIQLGISTSDRSLQIKKLYKEAVWALRSAEILNKKVSYYSDSLRISPFLPNSQIEAKELVYDVIGPLLDYDAQHQGNLIKTLYVFLSENQSWKKASEILFIHKQTLIYRINRIEKILNKKLSNINNVSEIWIALQAAIILNLVPEFSTEMI